jgi:hypothetical protein
MESVLASLLLDRKYTGTKDRTILKAIAKENLSNLLLIKTGEHNHHTSKVKVETVVKLVLEARLAQKVYNKVRMNTRMKLNDLLIQTIRRTALTEDRFDSDIYFNHFQTYEEARDAAFVARHKAERAVRDLIINVLSDIEGTSIYYANHYGEENLEKEVTASGNQSRKQLMHAVNMLQSLLD